MNAQNTALTDIQATHGRVSCQPIVDNSRPAIAPTLERFIATRDRRVAKASGHERAPITEHFTRLLRGDVVRVGGRASCGGAVDPTWVEFTAWNEVVRKARALGYRIDVTPIKHGNAWATKARGFWNENDYTLTPAASAATGANQS